MPSRPPSPSAIKAGCRTERVYDRAMPTPADREASMAASRRARLLLAGVSAEEIDRARNSVRRDLMREVLAAVLFLAAIAGLLLVAANVARWAAS